MSGLRQNIKPREAIHFGAAHLVEHRLVVIELRARARPACRCVPMVTIILPPRRTKAEKSGFVGVENRRQVPRGAPRTCRLRRSPARLAWRSRIRKPVTPSTPMPVVRGSVFWRRLPARGIACSRSGRCRWDRCSAATCRTSSRRWPAAWRTHSGYRRTRASRSARRSGTRPRSCRPDSGRRCWDSASPPTDDGPGLPCFTSKIARQAM